MGGAQTHVLELARALMRDGHALMVLVGGRGEFTEVLARERVPFTSLPSLRRAASPWHDTRAMLELLAALRAFQPELLSTHSSKACMLGGLAARTLGIPSLMTAHGWLLRPVAQSGPQRVLRSASWLMARLATRTVCVSHYDQALALAHNLYPSADALPVVHNAVADVPEACRATPSGTPPGIVTVTRLSPPKDVDTLLAALAGLRALPWTLEIIGDGPDRAACEAAIDRLGLHDRVVLAGTRDDVAQRLAAAQLFVLSSRREGFPITVVEAMRAGLPVIASDVGGIGEAVAHGETGALVPAGDVPAMRDALRGLLEAPAARERCGAAGRARYEAAFGFEQHYARIWAVYVATIDGA